MPRKNADKTRRRTVGRKPSVLYFSIAARANEPAKPKTAETWKHSQEAIAASDDFSFPQKRDEITTIGLIEAALDRSSPALREIQFRQIQRFGRGVVPEIFYDATHETHSSASSLLESACLFLSVCLSLSLVSFCFANDTSGKNA